ncbi:retinal-specific phospholipid-transporting ATPase ABCA4-like [Physella acuta]|uniref:retinal-specific phospholipid-transporting ATPase ABCA4-like n=1 Tax=Physella acuta TaxID=109671 RepID=UPI0027DE72C1|nr:retinal-specific phospholipid-transporting ATPase ABCA4-like [Physella acuta]
MGNTKVDPTPRQSTLRHTTTSQAASASQKLSTSVKEMPDLQEDDKMDKEQSVVLETKPDRIAATNTRVELHMCQFKAILIKRMIILKRSCLTLISVLLVNLLLTAAYVASTYVDFTLPMDFKLSDYKNITILVGKPSDKYSVAVYHGLMSLLPPDVLVVEPNRSLAFNRNIFRWVRANSMRRYKTEMMMGFEINQPPSPSIVHYQGYYVHSEPVAVDLFLNAHIRAWLGTNYSIQSGVLPDHVSSREIQMPMLSVMCILLALLSLHTVIISWLISERNSGARQLEAMTGVPVWIFWFANYLFDICLQLVFAAMFWPVILCQKSVNRLTLHLPMLIFTQLLFMLDILPFCYLFQTFFLRIPNAIITLIVYIVVNFLTTLMLSDKSFEAEFTTYVLYVLAVTSPYSKYYVVPLGIALNTLQESMEYTKEHSIFFAIHALCAWGLLFFMEYKNTIGLRSQVLEGQLVSKIEKAGRVIVNKTVTSADDDVEAEQNRILKTDLKLLFDTDALILVNVSKKYIVKNQVLTAVENTCLGIPKNECFGLLGQNGAGKTTTFKILTGEYASTSGDVYFNGLQLNSNLSKIHPMLGYCPQDDYLHGDLTGRESLYLFGRLRGVPEKSLPGVTNYLISAVLLDLHADKEAKKYRL